MTDPYDAEQEVTKSKLGTKLVGGFSVGKY